MGDVVSFTPQCNVHKMEASFAEKLRSYIRTLKDKNIELSPVCIARDIRGLYPNHMQGLMFPVIEFAGDLGIDVIGEHFPNDSKNIKGYLGLYPDKRKHPRIVVSDSESYGHQRWTVAHEIWHYLNHFDDDLENAQYYPEDSSNYDLRDASEESLANTFATELLMPEQLFRIAYQELSWWKRVFKSKRKLASAFMVSEEGVKRRINELRL